MKSSSIHGGGVHQVGQGRGAVQQEAPAPGDRAAGLLGQGGGSPGQADHHLQGVHCGLRVKKGPSLLSSACLDYHRKVNVYNMVYHFEI